MKAYEFSAEINADGKIKLPEIILKRIPNDQTIRVIIFISETTDEEKQMWSEMTAEQFLAGYSESDNIYDTL
ncbi:MAG: hypothetical protein AAB116_06730 [Candidatus Poribacteria bacterium]